MEGKRNTHQMGKLKINSKMLGIKQIISTVILNVVGLNTSV